MDQVNTVPQETTIDLSSIVDSLDDIIRSFSQFMSRGSSSAPEQLSTPIPSVSNMPETNLNTHKVLDLVQDYANHTSDVLRDLKVLRRALPATYFKNRSRIRDAFEGIEKTSAKCQANAFAIMDALQHHELMSRQSEHIADALKDVESRLNKVRNTLDR